MSTCPICKTVDAKGGDELEIDNSAPSAEKKEFYWCECTKCGKFRISWHAKENCLRDVNLQKISSWISEKNNISDEKIFLDKATIELIDKQRDRRIQEKFDCFMRSVSKLLFPVDGFSFLPNLPYSDKKQKKTITDFNHCYIYDNDEFENIVLRADQDGLLKGAGISYCYKGLTFEGQEYVENLELPNKHSHKIFLAFYFEKSIQDIFDNFVKPAIDNEGFLAERVSSSTAELDGKISDEIIAKIKSSRAVIADCTRQRQAVYFEAGFAMGMRIPVIWTCKKDDEKNICFDANHYPFILWETPEELVEKIINRLKREL